jgi:hypothetical protein
VSKRLLVQCLRVGAIALGVALVPAVFVLGPAAYYALVPRYSCVAYFWDKFLFNVRLDLFRTDETQDSGRYLTVITEFGYNRVAIEGSDWLHRARTGIYRVDGNHIVALSALGHDYMITLKPFATAPIASESGAQWQYLGAFDFVFPPGVKARLEFVEPKSSPECIPMARTDPASWATMPRPQVRAATCPSPPPNLGE